MKIKSPFIFLAAFLLFFAAVKAQTGGDFTIMQSVVAGGGQNATGGNFSLDGTIGQSLAGGALTGEPFSITSGFWNFTPMPATAATVTISGSVSSLRNIPIGKAKISLTGANGISRTALSNQAGVFRFENVAAGETYIVEVRHRRYVFTPQVVFVSEDLLDLNFTAQSYTKE